MTLVQLKVFVLVARLGSVRAAAAALGVSEPAVSQALAALRQHLGDPLIARSSGTMELTPAGQRVVGIASQMVNLAAEAEDAVRRSHGAPDLLRVVTTPTLAHAMVPALLETFTARHSNVEVNLGTATSSEMTALVAERLVDIALGPRLGDGLDSEPVMRYRLLAVVRPGPADRPPTEGGRVWLVDPTVADPSSDTARTLMRLKIPEPRVRVFPTQLAAAAAAVAGDGIALVVEHLVAADLARGALVPTPISGLPEEGRWFVSTVVGDRRSRVASRFRRFLSSPDAMFAMHRSDGGVPVSRFRPPVYVTIWS